MLSVRLTSLVVALSIASARANADERLVEFIERLQERGYHDLVVDYVERVRSRPDARDTVAVLADYYIGKSLMAGAESVGDLTKRDDQLERARTGLEKFVREHPEHERVAEAQMDQAQILVEHGHVALMRADNPENASKKAELQQQARSLYDQARQRFSAARDRLKTELKKFPASIPEEQKRLRDAKTLTQVQMMQAHLHMGNIEYEFAQTYDRSSTDYVKSLRRAIAVFEEVRQQFRDRLGGQYARMWQGKCFEEIGELVEAEGIYKELIEQDDKDPTLQAMLRQVQSFQIVVLNKRGDYILAADQARRWLQENSRDRHTELGLGVQFELAKALIQQAESGSTRTGDKNRLLAQAMDALTTVARYDTIYKQPAIALERKYKSMVGSTGAPVTYDQALSLADTAKDRGAWVDALGLYTQALKLARDNLDSESLATLRYKLAFANFQVKNYEEAAVLGEYVARHQRDAKIAAPAAQVALEAYAQAFNETLKSAKATEFFENRLVQLVEYVAATWPARAETTAARLLLGDLHFHFGRFEAAGQAFESVPAESPDRAHALARAGDAFWQWYVEEAAQPAELRKPEQMAQALSRAQTNLSQCLARFRSDVKSGAPLPVEMVDVVLSLAEASIEGGHAADAVQLMREFVPKIQAQPDLKGMELRALVALLRGSIATKDLRIAEDTMKSIEASDKQLAQITHVYLDLGKQLQLEMQRLRALGDQDKYERTRTSYVSFLDQLASRRSGQTFFTLQWTGEAFFGLEMYERASECFSQIVRQTLADPKFLDQAKPENRSALVQAKLRYVTALRKQQRFAEAWEQIRPLAPESNKANDPMHVGPTTNLDIILERGFVLEDWGANTPTQLKTAIDHWAYWGQQLEKLSPRPPQYWEVRLHLIQCLLSRARKPVDAKDRDQRLKQAEQQLLLLTKTSNTLGGTAYKAQFAEVRKELEKQLGRTLDSAPR